MNTLKKTLILLILILSNTTLQAEEKSTEKCLSYSEISNVEFYILKEREQNTFRETKTPIILWKQLGLKYGNAYPNQYFFHSDPVEFLKQLIKTAKVNYRDKTEYVLNTLTATYNVDDQKCVFSFPFSADEINKIRGSLKGHYDFRDSFHPVHINGQPYLVKGYVYDPFFIALSKIGYIGSIEYKN